LRRIMSTRCCTRRGIAPDLASLGTLPHSHSCAASIVSSTVVSAEDCE
jgi:hypothetical protein